MEFYKNNCLKILESYQGSKISERSEVQRVEPDICLYPTSGSIFYF